MFERYSARGVTKVTVGSSLYSDTACEVPKCPIAHPPIIGNVIIVEPL